MSADLSLQDKIRSARLYGIADMGYVSTCGLVAATRALCAGGVDILQLRAKNHNAAEVETFTRSMLPVTRDFGVPLIINDHPEVAAETGAEGCHVGQDDDSVAAARAVLGPGRLVGKSTHSLAQAEAAAAESPDYIGFGPLFATGTKPDYTPIGLGDIAEAHRRVSLPVFCIGGVNEERLDEILAAGARRVVVVSAFLQAPDVEAAVRRVRQRLP
jgi:thiamine-phosphate pyrophosphorylase